MNYSVDRQIAEEEMIEKAKRAFLPHECKADFENFSGRYDTFRFIINLRSPNSETMGNPDPGMETLKFEGDAARMRNASVFSATISEYQDKILKMGLPLNYQKFLNPLDK